MGRVLDIWRGWSARQRLALLGIAALALAGSILGAYLLLKRPGDISNPEAAFKPQQIPQQTQKRRVVQTVDWPVYGSDEQHTRYLPSWRLNPPFRPSLWNFQAGKLLEFSPIIADGTLYFMDEDALFYALDAEKGKVLWKRKIGSLNASAPAYADGRLYAVTLQPGQVVALRPRDGKVLWRKQLPGRTETSPVVAGKKLIVGSESGHVFGLNIASGKVEWEVQTAGAVKNAFALHDGLAFGGNYAGEMFAIKFSNGKVKWKTNTLGLSLGRPGRVYSTPTVAFGRVYLGSIDGRVYSFEEKTGKIAWTKSTGAEVYPSPAVADPPRSPPTVFIGSSDKTFYALDAKTGKTRWQHFLNGIVLGSPSVIGTTAYVAAIGPNRGTFGFNVKSGKKVFEHELGEYNPVISDGRRIYLTGYSAIRAFVPSTPNRGKLIPRRKPRGGRPGAPGQRRPSAAGPKRAARPQQRDQTSKRTGRPAARRCALASRTLCFP